MKTFLKILIPITFCYSSMCFSQYTVIPDTAFEQFLINQSIDTDGLLNGQVATSDINSIISLTLTNTTIHNLTGIQGFTAIESLIINEMPYLINLDLSQNIHLKQFHCEGTYYVNNFDFSSNLALEDLALRYNSINQLNISNNVNLTSLYCGSCGLSNLNVSNNINLTNLFCSHNELTSLNVFNNVNLRNLICYNNYLTSLNVTNNSLLEILWFDNNDVSFIDVSQNTTLKQLVFRNNNIVSVDLANNNLLETLISNNNPIESLNINNNPNLKSISCATNNITSINLNNNPLLDKFRCDNNSNLTTLYINNGSNSLLNGQYDMGSTPPIFYNRFNATNNPNLHCVFVDDVANCTANWLGVDASSHFVTTQAECDALSNEEFSFNEISIYPNPVKDILYINNQNETIEEIVVYDVLGKKVMEQNNNNAQINLSDLQSGFYVVKIKTEKGYICKKVVKE